MTTLQQVELGVLGPLQVRQYGLPVAIPGAKPRAILTMLGLHGGSVVSDDTLVELLWGDDPPRTAAKALQTHISALRRALGEGFVLTQGTGWTLTRTEIDATRYKTAAKLGRDAFSAGDVSEAATRFDEALALWRGTPELPDSQRGVSEKTRWIEGNAALVEDRADALLATGRAAEVIGELEAAVADAPLRERRWGQLMLALYRAGRQGEALGAYQRARSLLADELGVDPGPDLRRLEAAIAAQDESLQIPVSQQLSSVTRAVTFLLTDIEGSTAAWEADADAMAVALARHDEIVEQVVTSRGGRLVKTRGEGDATFSVFDRPSAAAAAAIELQEAVVHEPWALRDPMRIRVALHTGEVELRDGDYFGRAVNRAARLRSLAAGGQILCSGATAELVIDTLRDDVVLADLGMRQLKNLARPEHVFELRLETADDACALTSDAPPIERPALPAVLAGPGPFVGRGRELEKLLAAWQTTLDAGTRAVLIAGEPGVGKTRLAGEWSRQAYEQGAVVLYGRCDEDLGAPYQPFAEALRSLVPCLGSQRLRGLRGVESLLPLVPALADELPDLAAPARADADTERYALFDAVVALLGVASASAPVVLILDDLHWAARPTLLLLRHLLRFGEHARVQIVGTYRSTDLDRSHPLAAMLADLHRDGSAHRLALSGLDEDDVTAYVAEAGYDEELARALASVTGGNPFFLIEALRHVDESGGRWDPSTLPQGVREAVSRRLSRLPSETNKALAAAAVVGSRFELALVERVVGADLIDAFDEAGKAGIVIEEPGGRYRFNHALVRQSLLAELASVRRMRLHQRIATTLETESGGDDELLAELAYHYFECAWAGNAAKAVDYCRRAADQAMARLAYEGAADLYDKALHALEELDDELPDRDDLQAELLVARCEALLAAGDVVSARGAVSQLQEAAGYSARLVAWGTCFDGQLSMLTDPERLDEIESAVRAAAEKLAVLEDPAGEAKAHTVRATCLGRLGRIGDCETALDQALTAARRAGEHRRVNNVLANAPLAALWGPNPVPRAGGRCLDVVRLLRITTGSPVVEATSTRCQGVLDAFRGRAAAGRQLIDSARRSLTELGMRHALLEVDQFAGIVELVADDPAAAEPYLRRAYNGFRRMGLDADTAETAALLARGCLALDEDAEAEELCRESERLAGHALKAAIAWRTVRAQLLARRGDHDEARRVAEEAVALAGRTDALVDHGDACLALAAVLSAAGDTSGARAAAEEAVSLYELKGAAALAEKARSILGKHNVSTAPTAPEAPTATLDNECVRVGHQMLAAFDRGAWDEAEKMYAPDVVVESRRKIVGFPQADVASGDWPPVARHLREGWAWFRLAVIAVRGERLALTRFELGTDDASPDAPHEEMLGLWGLNEHGQLALQVFFDVEDLDAATAELDAVHARFEEPHAQTRLENAASRAEDRFHALYADGRWGEIAAMLTDDVVVKERRRGFRRETYDRAGEMSEVRTIADLGVKKMTSEVVAIRGERLVLSRVHFSGREQRSDTFHTELLRIAEIDYGERFVTVITFDLDDFDAALAELDARYLAGEAAPHAHTWSVIAHAYTAFGRRDLFPTTPDWVSVDHRPGTTVGPGNLKAFIRASWADTPDARIYIEAVHRLTDIGAVATSASRGTAQEGFAVEWREIAVTTVDGDMIRRIELFDEADLDAAITRFDELSRPAPGLENAASRLYARFWASFANRDWAAMSEIIAGNYRGNDRRRVVNAGVRNGRGAEIANLRAIADLGVGVDFRTIDAIATRGQHLVLVHELWSGTDKLLETFQDEVLEIVEIDKDQQITAAVTFDPDDIDAAFEELDARYVAGEAAPHAGVWQSAIDVLGEANRHEPGPILSRLTYVDHRRVSFGSGDFGRAVEELWALVPDARYRVTAVHALDARGIVASLVIEGTDTRGNELQWPRIVVLVPDERRMEVYEENDLDVALARFEQQRPRIPLENTASRVEYQCYRLFADGRPDAIGVLLAENHYNEDRRCGLRRETIGRAAALDNIRAIAALDVNITNTPIALRGDRLCLSHIRFEQRKANADVFSVETLELTETDTDGTMAARVVFDPDNIDAAIQELDARYLAHEAAPYSRTWLVITRAYAGFNARELVKTTPDWVSIDRRRGAGFAPGDMIAYIHAAWDDSPDTEIYIAAVHRLSNLGAVVTHVAHGISQEGFDAEWRDVHLLTVDGDMVNRGELFDESNLDAAIAKFDELSRPTPRLANAASQAYERFWACFAARNWTAMAQVLASDTVSDDRRRVVNAGIRHGRDAILADMRALGEVGTADNTTSTVIATRGERITLNRIHSPVLQTELLNIAEIDADARIVGVVVFDIDAIDAAFAELDARYLLGEAAAHAQTWSLVTEAYAALNRHELPLTTPDWVNLDHRRGRALVAGDMVAYIRASWDVTPDIRWRIEAVHRLNHTGAVLTQVSGGNSRDGFNAESRVISVLTFGSDLINHGEMFDEADLDAALARFDELCRAAPRLKNAASQVCERFRGHFATRDWDAARDIFADNFSLDDRRRTVNAGIRDGRDAEIADLRAAAEVGFTDVAGDVIAIRGQRLALARVQWSGPDRHSEAFRNEWFGVIEIDADEQFTALVMIELDDIDAAFEELDARYLAGEAAAHAHTWSVIADVYTALNRHELSPTTADWVNIDHRQGTAFAPGDLDAYLRTSWDMLVEFNVHIETVHRLTNLGAVFTRVANGTSREGFEAEWREISISMVDGDLITRSEIFDEADLDAALARFDELSAWTPRLENAATRVLARGADAFNHRALDRFLVLLTEDGRYEDRRKGLRDEGPLKPGFARRIFVEAAPSWQEEMEPVAIRGSCLMLCRIMFRDHSEVERPIAVEALGLAEVTTDELMSRFVLFDPDDINGAFNELTDRWIASGEIEHPEIIEGHLKLVDIANRHDWDTFATLSAGAAYVGHRQLAVGADTIADYISSIRTLASLVPDLWLEPAEILAYSALGVLTYVVVKGTSTDGAPIELPLVILVLFDGDRVSRVETFDPDQRALALARFEELRR